MSINKLTNFALFIAILVFSTILLAACSSQLTTTPTSESSPIEDGLGRELAQRVVSLAPSNTEILFAVGAGDQVIGRDEFSDYPDQANTLPSVGGGFGDYNLEAIVDLEPDLVLAAEINTPEQVKALEDLGLTVFLLPNPISIEEMYGNLLTVAKLTGHESETEELVEELRDRVSQVEMGIESAEDQPTTFYELDATDPSAPWTAGSGTFINTLITMAGGVNIASDMEGQYLQISVEELLISAIVNSRVYAFDDNLVSRPGPRLVDGLEELARLLHPNLFTD
jgi:iron complex transport system substrate-binding protein